MSVGHGGDPFSPGGIWFGELNWQLLYSRSSLNCCVSPQYGSYVYITSRPSRHFNAFLHLPALPAPSCPPPAPQPGIHGCEPLQAAARHPGRGGGVWGCQSVWAYMRVRLWDRVWRRGVGLMMGSQAVLS